jgi:toxin FitB
MSFLLDTNVLSEPRQKKPNANVINWFQRTPLEQTFISVVTLGEIEQGIAHLDARGETARAQNLRHWLETSLLEMFEHRILNLDWACMRRWGNLTGQAMAQGQTAPAFDAVLAATAVQHNLTLVTGNTKDFKSLNVKLLDPWL